MSSGRCVHNLLMLGPPGAEKARLARCLATPLPAMSLAAAPETAHLHHVGGLTALVTMRPLPQRMPAYPDEHGRW